VQRADDIAAFKPERFWRLQAAAALPETVEQGRGQVGRKPRPAPPSGLPAGTGSAFARLDSGTAPSAASPSAIGLPLQWERSRCFDPGVARALLDEVRASARFVVTSWKQETSMQPRPQPLNTVALLKSASRALGMGPH